MIIEHTNVFGGWKIFIACILLGGPASLSAIDFTTGGEWVGSNGKTIIVPPSSGWDTLTSFVSGGGMPGFVYWAAGDSNGNYLYEYRIKPLETYFSIEQRFRRTLNGVGEHTPTGSWSAWGSYGGYAYSDGVWTPRPDPGVVANIEEGDIGDPMIDGFAATVQVTFDDNGEVRYFDVKSSDGTYRKMWLNSDAGRTYKQKVFVYPLDVEHPPGSHTDPGSVMDFEDGVVPPSHLPPPVVTVASPPPGQFQFETVGNVVGSDGSVNPVTQISGGSVGTTVVAPKTGGGYHVGVVGGASGSGAGGSFVSNGTEATQLDLNDVKNLLRQGNIQREFYGSEGLKKLDDIAAKLSPSPSPSPSPSSSPSPSPSPSPDEEPVVERVFDAFVPDSYVGGLEAAPTVSGGGNNVNWTLTLPGGYVVNANPMDNPLFVQLFAWLRLVAFWILTIWITQHVYCKVHKLGEDLLASLQSADIHRLTLMKEKKGWISGLVELIPGYGIVKMIVVNLFWKSAIVVAILVFAGLVGGQFFTVGGVTNWVFGGQGVVGGFAAALAGEGSLVSTVLFFLGQVIPLDHLCLCLLIWAGIDAVSFGILMGFSFFVRFV
ncbi:MAG: hypothetical protein WC003_15505 [Terrimicrobiaceae bacterium]|nr:hypothetical protein [Terrimicrobiaceae bacterium]